MKKYLFCIVFCCLGSYATFGQNTRSFSFFLNEVNLKYEQPTNYKYMDSTETLHLKTGKVYSSAFYSIKNTVSDVAIVFVIIPISAKLIRDSITFKGLIVPNQSYINYAKNHADTTFSKLNKINLKKLGEVNADAGFIFDGSMDSTYKGKYTAAKVVILHKQNIGDIELFYFYNEKSKKDIEAEIKRTWGMVKFRPNEMWHPKYK